LDPGFPVTGRLVIGGAKGFQPEKAVRSKIIINNNTDLKRKIRENNSSKVQNLSGKSDSRED
jgi:hypothetical protein